MTDNLLRRIPTDLADELVSTLLSGTQFRVERIVSRGHVSPADFWYEQTEHEWVLLVSGRATLRFAADDKIIELEPGDYLNIPCHRRHRVEWTTPDTDTVWLAIYYQS